MDKEFIREIISNEDWASDKLIKNGDFIDYELLEMLGKASKRNLQKAFYSHNGNIPSEGYKYIVELQCPVCNSLHKKILSKSKLMQALGYSITCSHDKYIRYCDTCKLKKEEQEIIERENYNKIYGKIETIKADQYIENYLNPNKIFRKDISSNEKINNIMGDFFGYSFNDEIEKVILKMDYYDFLKTPYWDGVRNYKLKREKYCCQLCGTKGILNVHHKTYKSHGKEHIRSIADKDLIVLCKDCHQKFHDKLGDKGVSE